MAAAAIAVAVRALALTLPIITVAVIAMTMGTRLLAAVLPVVLVGTGAGRGQSLVADPVAGGDPLPGHALVVAQQAAPLKGAAGNFLALSARTGGVRHGGV